MNLLFQSGVTKKIKQLISGINLFIKKFNLHNFSYGFSIDETETQEKLYYGQMVRDYWFKNFPGKERYTLITLSKMN